MEKLKNAKNVKKHDLNKKRKNVYYIYAWKVGSGKWCGAGCDTTACTSARSRPVAETGMRCNARHLWPAAPVVSALTAAAAAAAAADTGHCVTLGTLRLAGMA